MNIEALKHNLKWHSPVGDIIRSIIMWFGLKFLRIGRRLLKWSGGRCSWCGVSCGFNSSITKKGLRCSSLNRHCDNEPEV